MGVRTERFELRLSERDLAVMDERRGSRTRADWLRSRIHSTYDSEPFVKPPPVEVEIEGNTFAPPAEALIDDGVSTVLRDMAGVGHRHRRGRVISTQHVKGQKIREYACADETCDHILEEK